ncbi:MAG: hypothetical protein Q8P50_02790 [Bacillota bacterium]|nr:hypothetical protein [Bacillota bacterium]
MKVNVKVITGDNSRPGVLSTEHSSSSYGMPVLLIEGEPHGIADLPPGTIIKTAKALSLEAYAAIVRADYRVKAVIRTSQDIDAEAGAPRWYRHPRRCGRSGRRSRMRCGSTWPGARVDRQQRKALLLTGGRAFLFSTAHKVRRPGA